MYFKITIVTFCLILTTEGGSTVQTHSVKELLSSRIVGGTEAPPGFAKHMVALVFGKVFRLVSCGGSIITKKHVLTAAHCIDPFIYPWGGNGIDPQLRGSIGSIYWESTEYMIDFERFINHPEWNSFTIKNDIGVLITKAAIRYNDAIGPIALNFKHIDDPVKSFVTGWGNLELFGGSPERLQLLIKGTITSKQCIAEVKNASTQFSPPHDPQSEICSLHSYGHGMCHGDSGSALVTYATRQQIGIVSWGFPCARGAPDIFTRVSAFNDFLANAVAPYSLTTLNMIQ